ncbi:MAG TPA: glycosyl hydrolase family 28-related protein [Vicinamibacterales bacterium]|nr:glycosyl hydrolase family 28-related protein [Vicinamibacterales bacterium]
MKPTLLALAFAAVAAVPAAAQVQPGTSAYTTRLDDPRAVHLSDAKGDGIADDTAAIQAAIDKASDDRGEGIVFIPQGRYRLTHTIYVWPAVRVIGWGATRPVFVLADNTPGFQDGIGAMVIFAGARLRPAVAGPGRGGPGRGGFRVPFPPPDSVPANDRISDANPGTFYSALSNVDFEIGAGNAAAVGIRFHGAQHDYLSHIDFHIGSGLAGIHQVANEAEDLRFFGGRYGILAEKPSPAWQFTLIDGQFQGQRDAAIREHEASLTLVNNHFRDVPVAVDIDPDYSDWLWIKDSRFENVSNAAIVISAENNVYTQIGVEHAVAASTPVFARLRESGKTFGRGGIYQVNALNHGLILPSPGEMGAIGTRFDAVPLSAMPAPPPPAIRALPATSEWVSLRTLGVTGDGKTDDTAAIQHAIDTTRVLYVPAGRYIVHDTIRLKPDTVLIGLHPSITQFDLPDRTEGFQGVGAPKALMETPKGGHNIVSGIGLFTGGINDRAVELLWRSGADSLLDDVRFLGGHGTNNPDGSRMNPYNETHSADPDFHKRWDGQYPSLWVTDGGGGTFTNLWTVDTYAQAGMYVSDTTTPGKVYELSDEHHVRTEFALNRVENWDFYAPQTEEESGESQEAHSLEISNSRHITIANYHAYRVTRTIRPVDTAVQIFNSSDIRFRNMHVNAESGLGTCDANGCGTYLRASKFPYENAIIDATHHIQVREREFAVLDIPADPPAPKASDMGQKVQTLADGFYSIAGAAVDAHGKLYFVDHHQQRIYGWSKTEGLSVERDNPLDPVNLTFDKSGNLIVRSSLGAEGSVYTFKPGSPATELTMIPATAATAHPDATIALPVNYWNNGEFKDQLDLKTYRYATFAEMFARDMAAPTPKEYVSPDGSLVLRQARVFQQGPPDDTGWRFSNDLETYGFVTAKAGSRTFISNESEAKTYSGLVHPDGTITDLKVFADRGGEGVAVAPDGKVYVANGQIFVYAPDGKPLGRVDVPERPLQILFGGDDGRTLFILAHHALYAVRI